MSVNVNYVVKVTDAKLSDIHKALEQGGIKLRSIVEVYKEEVAPAEK